MVDTLTISIQNILNGPLQSATFAARERTGKLIGVAVKQGLFQVQNIIPTKRSAIIEPLSEYLPLEQAIDALNALQGAKGES